MEDESTVMTVSQEINRPNGAYAALNFFWAATPAVLSENKLIGERVGNWFAGTTGNGCGDALGKPDEVADDAVDEAEAGSGLAAGGWKAVIGRTTDCTTWGLPPTVLVPSGAAEAASSGAWWCLRTTLKIMSAAANKPPKAINLPLLVLKKLRKSRGFMAGLWVNGWDAPEHW